MMQSRVRGRMSVLWGPEGSRRFVTRLAVGIKIYNGSIGNTISMDGSIVSS